MKRFIACFLGLLMLCGCTKQTRKPIPVTKNLSFTVNATYYNENYTCLGRLDENSNLSLTVTAPKELSDMELISTGNSFKIAYKGLTYTPKGGSMPLPNVCQTIQKVIKSVQSTDNADSDGENYTLNAKADGTEYIFVFSPVGYPISLKLPSDAFSAEFSDVAVFKS